MQLDAITNGKFQQLKLHLHDKSPKTAKRRARALKAATPKHHGTLFRPPLDGLRRLHRFQPNGWVDLRFELGDSTRFAVESLAKLW